MRQFALLFYLYCGEQTISESLSLRYNERTRPVSAASQQSSPRRDGRVAEGARLESAHVPSHQV